MTHEKLTYSGNVCNNYLYFSFDGESFDTDLVTRELEIQPTAVKRKKELGSKMSSWKYKVNVGDKIDLESPLENLIDLFRRKIEVINDLKQKLDLSTRLQFVIDIDINPQASTPYFGLNQKAIEFLSQTGTVVDFDIYKADTIGVIIEE